MANTYRILITGSREFDSLALLTFELALAIGESGAHRDEITVVHGGAQGADTMAAQVAEGYHCRTEEHRADWEAPCRPSCQRGHRRKRRDGSTYCPAAGNYRNAEMAALGADVCLALFQPGAASRGTSDCVRKALDAGIPVRAFGEVPEWVTAAGDVSATPRRRE
jgi:hypothetical protein